MDNVHNFMEDQFKMAREEIRDVKSEERRNYSEKKQARSKLSKIRLQGMRAV